MSFSLRAFVFVFTMAAFATKAASAEPRSGTLELDTTKTLIEFRLPGALHTTHGIFKLEHGTIRANLGTGEADGSIVVDAKSGDSGIGARDERMKDRVLEVQKYSEIIFMPRHVAGHLASDGTFQAKLQGVLTVHGSGHQIVLEVKGRLLGNTLAASCSFSVPYVDWGMEDPSVLFLTVGKKVEIDVATAGYIVRTDDSARTPHK